MGNTTNFEAELVKSKRIPRPYFIISLVIFLLPMALFYFPESFGFEKGILPLYVKIIAAVFYIVGAVGVFYESLSRPVKIGTLCITPDKFEIVTDAEEMEIPFNTINIIKFDYFGPIAKFSSMYGNKNYLRVESDNKDWKFEIILNSKEHKDKLKESFNLFKANGIKTRIYSKTLKYF